MKKMRKVFAMLLAFAMVMGMSLTTFAATKNEATITVNNAENATLSYVQVIEPDTTSVTGWKFTSTEIAADYTEAFGITDAQEAIAMLIKAEDASAKLPVAYATVKAATAAQIDKALSNVANGVTFADMSSPLTVNEAGVYAITATEEGYSYKTMSAYVGFGEVVNEESGEVVYTYPSLLDTTVTAKKSSLDLTKDVADSDLITQIGDTLTYTITTKVPYIDANATNRTFKVTDTISGASYYLTGEGSVATIKMADKTVDGATFDVNGNSFTIDLSALITADNENAGRDIEIKYTAKVTAININNTAANHVSGKQVDTDSEVLTTGSIQLLKTDDTDAKNPLANAEFKVYDKADSTKTYLTFTLVDGVYVYDPASTNTVLVTNEDGLIVVKGLDVGTYHFDETKAPAGYSINEVGVDATIAVDNAETTINELFPEVSIVDTKLSALPSTGGIGTAVSTIGGCAIMIAAAYFFFVSRKKEA